MDMYFKTANFSDKYVPVKKKIDWKSEKTNYIFWNEKGLQQRQQMFLEENKPGCEGKIFMRNFNISRNY